MDFSYFSKNLRRLRRGMTQGELGRNLDIDQSLISDYERGNVKPSGENLWKIAHYFGISIDELLGRGNLTAYEYSTSEDFSEFLHILAQIVAVDNRKNFLRSLMGLLQLAVQKTHKGKEGIAEALGRLAELSEKYRNKP